MGLENKVEDDDNESWFKKGARKALTWGLIGTIGFGAGYALKPSVDSLTKSVANRLTNDTKVEEVKKPGIQFDGETYAGPHLTSIAKKTLADEGNETPTETEVYNRIKDIQEQNNLTPNKHNDTMWGDKGEVYNSGEGEEPREEVKSDLTHYGELNGNEVWGDGLVDKLSRKELGMQKGEVNGKKGQKPKPKQTTTENGEKTGEITKKGSSEARGADSDGTISEEPYTIQNSLKRILSEARGDVFKDSFNYEDNSTEGSFNYKDNSIKDSFNTYNFNTVPEEKESLEEKTEQPVEQQKKRSKERKTEKSEEPCNAFLSFQASLDAEKTGKSEEDIFYDLKEVSLNTGSDSLTKAWVDMDGDKEYDSGEKKLDVSRLNQGESLDKEISLSQQQITDGDSSITAKFQCDGIEKTFSQKLFPDDYQGPVGKETEDTEKKTVKNRTDKTDDDSVIYELLETKDNGEKEYGVNIDINNEPNMDKVFFDANDNQEVDKFKEFKRGLFLGKNYHEKQKVEVEEGETFNPKVYIIDKCNNIRTIEGEKADENVTSENEKVDVSGEPLEPGELYFKTDKGWWANETGLMNIDDINDYIHKGLSERGIEVDKEDVTMSIPEQKEVGFYSVGEDGEPQEVEIKPLYGTENPSEKGDKERISERESNLFRNMPGNYNLMKKSYGEDTDKGIKNVSDKDLEFFINKTEFEKSKEADLPGVYDTNNAGTNTYAAITYDDNDRITDVERFEVEGKPNKDWKVNMLEEAIKLYGAGAVGANNYGEDITNYNIVESGPIDNNPPDPHPGN